MNEFVPYTYQSYNIQRIIDNERVGLFLDMGLGKTIIALTALEEMLYDRFLSSYVLVIAPKMVCNSVWRQEAEKWSHTKHLNVVFIDGKPDKRINAVHKKADIHLISRDNVVWLVDYLKGDWFFDTLVIDELSSFKNPRSKRFRALKKVLPKIERRIGLTGTPMPNSYIDLWSQMFLLDDGERLYTSHTKFKDEYFKPDKRNGMQVWSYKFKDKECEHRISEKISDICVSMKKEDYLSLPERIDNYIQITLDSKAEKAYKKLKKEMVLKLKEEEITCVNAAALCNKLLQLSNGAVYTDERKAQEIHSGKLEALEELYEGLAGRNLLVFYSFKHDIKRIKEKFKGIKVAELKEEGALEAWNKGEIEILLAHPGSAGYGLNLQAGGNQICWFGLTWSLESYQQANARLHRQGQKNKVTIHHLIVKNTMDERVMAAIESKDVSQERLIDALKAVLKEEE